MNFFSVDDGRERENCTKDETDLPFVAHFLNQIGDIVHVVLMSFVVDYGAEVQFKRVTRQRTS